MNRILALLGTASLLLVLLVSCSTVDDPAPPSRPPGVGFDFGGLAPAADAGLHPDRGFAVNAHADAGLVSLSVTIEDVGTVALPPRARTETSFAGLAADLDGFAFADGARYRLVATAVDGAGRAAEATADVLVDAGAPTGGDVAAPGTGGTGGDGSDDDGADGDGSDGTTAELRVVPVVPTASKVVAGTTPIEFLVRARDTVPEIVTVTVNETLVDADPRWEAVPATGAFANRRYAIDWDTTAFVDGDATIRVEVEDATGAVGATHATTVRVFNDDAEDPEFGWIRPMPGATVAGGDFEFAFSASDDSGAPRVAVYVDDNLIRDGASSPFAWNTRSVADGVHEVRAVVRDPAGNEIERTLPVTVENHDVVDPTLAWTHPVDAQRVSGVVPLRFDAADDSGVVDVELQVDGTTHEDDVFSGMTWDTSALADGDHVLRLVATDPSGNRVADEVTVAVANEVPPSVRWVTPKNDAVVSGETVGLVVEAWDDEHVADVTFLVDGVVAEVDPDPSAGEAGGDARSFLWDSTEVADGLRTLEAVVTDTDGLIATASLVVAVANDDVADPAVAWTTPRNEATISGDEPLEAHVTDDRTIDRVEFWRDDRRIGVLPGDGDGSYGFSWSTLEAVDGTHDLTVVAYDAAGNAAEAVITVHVENEDHVDPVAGWESPAEAATVAGDRDLAIRAEDDEALASVAFYAGDVWLGAVTDAALLAGPTVTFEGWDTTAHADGTLLLRAEVRDAQGNTTTVERRVTVANDVAEPDVRWTRPAVAETATGPTDLEVSATDDNAVDGVDLEVDGRRVGSFVDTGAGVYRYSWDSAGVADGTHELIAVATDAYGKSTAAALEVVSANDPVVTWAAPSAGRSLAGLVPLDIDVAGGRGVVQWVVGYRREGGETVQPIDSGDVAGGTEATWNTLDLAPGAYTLVASATDEGGRVVTSEIDVDVASAFVLTNPLSADPIGPAANRRQVDVTVGLAGTLPRDANVAMVEILIGATGADRIATRAADSVGGAAFVYSWDTCEASAGHRPDVAGDRTITARVTLSDGTIVSSRLSDGVTVDFQAGCL